MNKEVISDKEGIFVIIVFILGTATMLVRGIEAKQDFWISLILALVIALIMAYLYARIHFLFPGKDLLDILQLCFGTIIGNIIGLLYVWFTFYLSTLVVCDYGYYITSVSLNETPMIVLNTIVILLSTYAVKKGLNVIVRWSQAFTPTLFILLSSFILLLIPEMKISNIQPILYNGIKPIIRGSFSAFSFPFAEIVVFTMCFSHFKSDNSPFRIYLKGLLISGIILILISTANVLVLGSDFVLISYFPAHTAAAKVSIGNLLERMEVILDLIFILATFIKLSVCLLATGKIFGKILGFDDYRILVTPIALLIANLSYFLHDSIMHFFRWDIEIWPYFAFPFQVIFPICLFIVAKIKNKRLVNSQ